jgi:hypothetical protein
VSVGNRASVGCHWVETRLGLDVNETRPPDTRDYVPVAINSKGMDSMVVTYIRGRERWERGHHLRQ